MSWTLSVVVLLAFDAASEAAWSKPGKAGAVTVQKRPVAGSALSEFRVTATSPLEPGALCQAAYDMASRDQRNPDVKHTEIRSETANERVVYNQVSHAMVANRDYAMRVVRTPAADGSCGVDFDIANDKAPPAPPGYVRMTRLHGTWRFVRETQGTRVVHTLFADPGGKVPLFLMQGEPQRIAEHDTQLLFQMAREQAGAGSNR